MRQIETVMEAKATETAVSVRDVNMVFYTDGNRVPVLENISLDIRRGEFVCLLGPSGCGKSTMLNIVAGFLQPTSGEVTIEGERVHGPDPRRIFVFQERGVFPWLTVEGNIGFGLFKLSGEEKAKRIEHYVHLVRRRGAAMKAAHAVGRWAAGCRPGRRPAA